ncbi:Trp biosynthesis-associated membrane protein [uncultured Friedmanniella sp.]|uniref:Trp biosynthesis-associated membrane protein n=1 Tax=uncultured Friedmanniella sp. TaxID=335381 RepID=UPI0035CAC002
MAEASRLRTRALVPGLLGAALSLLAGAQSWWRARGEGVSVAFSGTETTAGLSQALGVVALAAWLLVLVLRTRGRRVVGVLTVVTGAAIATLGGLRRQPNAATVRAGVREVSLADQFALVGSVWPYVYAVAGLLVLTAGLLVTLTAGRWPQRSDRFTRAAATARVTAEDDPAEVWRAQDAGLDPTTEPDVRDEDIRDTMDEDHPTRQGPPT